MELVMSEAAARVRDRNIRLFAEGDRIHALSGKMYLEGADPFVLRLDPEHPEDSIVMVRPWLRGGNAEPASRTEPQSIPEPDRPSPN